ncbi:hypothetical protein GBA52_002056 [Prunus armeniaca]|nr:hypothetical protein GBA52_002056 [Prunus armeniaca]
MGTHAHQTKPRKENKSRRNKKKGDSPNYNIINIPSPAGYIGVPPHTTTVGKVSN